MTKTKRDFLKKLPQIVAALKKGYKPEKIILFGSMLDPKSESNDIDLFLVKNGVEKLPRSERSYQIRRFLPRDVPMDLLIYTPYEVEKRLYLRDPFVKTIIENGRVLYDA